MKERETFPGRAYAVTTQSGCNVYADEAGTQLIKTVEAGQGYFVAIGSRTWVDDDAAIVTETFNGAATAALGGGSTFTVDLTFSAASENAQSGVAVQEAFSKNGIAINNATINLNTKADTHNTYARLYIRDMTLAAGVSLKNFYDRGVTLGCNATGYYGATTVGLNATSSGFYSSAYGIDTKAGGMGSIAIGSSSQTTANMSTAIGLATVVKDTGVTAISCNTQMDWTTTGDANIQTLFYIIGANTPLATKYENGAACLGYVVKDGTGNILECGTRKLSELLTNNTAFAPTDLETEATPFMPTGITDPIEFPEELTEEQLNH